MNTSNRRKYNARICLAAFALAVLLAAFSGCTRTSVAGPSLPAPSPSDILSHLKYLASDSLEGRATGERGGELAAEYIVEQFQKLGLLPHGYAGTEKAAAIKGASEGTAPTTSAELGSAAGDGKDFRQYFEATIGVSMGEGNSLTVSFPEGDSTYVYGEDFIPFSFSASGSVTAPVTFAGYGISSEQYGYDDYGKLELDSSTALVMRHEPGEQDENSVFEGKALTHYSDLRYKATSAREHGASAIMVTTDPLNHPPEEDELLRLQSREGLGDCGLPAVQVKQRIAEAILRAQGLDLEELQARIDSLLEPNTVAVPSVTASLNVDLVKEKRNVANVVGVLKPRNREVSEYVVVGAHYDHLGRGGESSLSGEGEVHNGADDNASGLSAMLDLARMFAAKRDSLKRGIVFVGFVGEEIGVLGSTFYVNNPSIPLENTVLMLNLDTVGRMRDQKLYAAGVGSSPVIKKLIETGNAGLSLEIETSEGGYGPSDHFPFYGKGIPVLFFFTGAHGDYHKVTDDWEKINIGGVASVVRLSSVILSELVFSDMEVPFTRAASETAGPPGGEGYGRGSGAWFGIVPDFGGEPGEGAKISGTSEGSPAEKAGLKAGDVIIKLGDKTVTGLHDLSYALREHKPGDEVTVVVVRGGQELKFTVTLSRRSEK